MYVRIGLFIISFPSINNAREACALRIYCYKHLKSTLD